MNSKGPWDIQHGGLLSSYMYVTCVCGNIEYIKFSVQTLFMPLSKQNCIHNLKWNLKNDKCEKKGNIINIMLKWICSNHK